MRDGGDRVSGCVILDSGIVARKNGKRLPCEVLQAENAKLRELFNETLIRLVAANEAAGGGFTDARYCELLESHGIEVGDGTK